MRILVVEDEALIAMSLEAGLTDAGHVVLGPASTAARAMELAEQDEPPDLAVVNINLRDGHGQGIELARALLERWGTPSLFVSGQRREAYAARDVALGYIGKPYSLDTVVRSVEFAGQVMDAAVANPNPPRGLEVFDGSDGKAKPSGD